MSPRAFPLLLGLSLLLTACTNPSETAPPSSAAASSSTTREALPPDQRELSGNLLGAPADSEVELAVLLVDERGMPHEELGSTRLTGNGQALPFNLRFHPQPSSAGMRLELRGRASQSGRLILRLPPRPLSAVDSQRLGSLQLIPAP